LGLRGTMYRGSGENYVMRSLRSVPLTQYCSGDEIENNEMGGACSAYREEERRTQSFGGKT